MTMNGTEQIVRTTINGATIWVQQGNERFVRGDTAGAIADYDRAIASEPKLAIAWYAKGVVLDTAGKYAEAVGCYDRALASDPFDADCLFNKGVALAKLGRTEEAVATARIAVRSGMGI